MVEDGLSACIKRSVYAVHCGLKSVERGFRAFHHSSERILSLTSLITKSMQFIQHHQDLKPLTAAVSLGYGKQHKNWEKGVKSVKLTHTKKEKSKEKTFTCRSMFVEDDLEGCRGLESKCCIDLSIDLHHSSSSDFSILHQYSWFMKTHRCRWICQNFINGCVKFLWLLPELSWWAHLWKAHIIEVTSVWCGVDSTTPVCFSCARATDDAHLCMSIHSVHRVTRTVCSLYLLINGLWTQH